MSKNARHRAKFQRSAEAGRSADKTDQKGVTGTDRLFQATRLESLAFFRVAFGAIMLWEIFRYFAADRIRRFYVEPGFFFTYFGFDWVRPWSEGWMNVHFVALGALAILILVGLFTRLSAGLFFAGFTYVFLLDQSRYLNHFYLVCLISLLMIFVPANGTWSLDAHWGLVRRTLFGPAWSLWLLRAQIGLVYVFGGIAKLNGDWIRGEPIRGWLAERTGMPIVGPLLGSDAAVWIFAWGGLAFDLLVVPALSWRRTRALAFVLAVLFHLTNALVFQIGIFPWLMIAATTLFFEPDWPLRRNSSRPAATLPINLSSAFRRTVMASLSLYLLIQLLVPLRHLLYPGNVNWTEEGHRFSWRMKLRSKQGETQFFVTERSTGSTRVVNPAECLLPAQLDEMSTRPDMILQFAHHLAGWEHRRESSQVEVRVMARVSLNGRRPQLLISPSVDLAAEPRSLRPARWIVPLGEPLPHRSPPNR